jgi:phosphatidylinositol N-acetylglucosaminyltransferase subunit C
MSLLFVSSPRSTKEFFCGCGNATHRNFNSAYNYRQLWVRKMIRPSISDPKEDLPARNSSHTSRYSTSSSSPSPSSALSTLPSTTRSRHNLSSLSISPSSTSSKPWKKVLYERQPYPDNYIDSEKFLSELDMNSTSRPLTFYGIFLNTAAIIQQITAVVLFLLVHRLIQQPNEVINSYYLLFLNCCLLFLIYSISILCHETILISLKSLVLFLICLRIIAPILQTLTSSYSDDTIDALVLIFSTIHLVFHDYAYVNNTKENFSGNSAPSPLLLTSLSLSGNVSLNAAMFTAVLLASRLHKIELVTAFIALAIISFSFLPRIFKIMKRHSITLHLSITLLLWLAASLLLASFDNTLLVIYQLILGFVWIVCPAWLAFLSQTSKKRLRGPWDIAELPDCDESNDFSTVTCSSVSDKTSGSAAIDLASPRAVSEDKS